MNKSKIFKRSKIVSLTLALLMACLVFLPLHSNAGVCEAALARCAIDVLIVGLVSGVNLGAVYAVGCGFGYTWCLRYYK